MLFFQEAAGGIVLGLALAWLAFNLMRLIDDASLNVLLPPALVLGGTQVALLFHFSAPLMADSAGLLIGGAGQGHKMSHSTRKHVDMFWELLDKLLNAVLFLLIGIEVLVVAFPADQLVALAFAIVIALAARFAAVSVPILILQPVRKISAGVIPLLTWGGLKGGISVALALSLPDNEWKPLILFGNLCNSCFFNTRSGLYDGSSHEAHHEVERSP